MKQWGEIKQEFLDKMRDDIGEREAEAQFKLLYEFYTNEYGYTPTDLQKSVWQEQYLKIEQQIARLYKGEPIQYVLGYAYFDDMKLKVNPSVLIPRQETEELVYWIVNDFKQYSPQNILDIGTGSGAIALALAKHFPQSNVLGVDVSSDALAIAEANRAALSITNCSFQQTDILQNSKFEQHFDLIVSNPPYITKDYASKMEQIVTEHEPHLALFVSDDDPLLFYRAIADSTITHHSSLINNQSSPITYLYFEVNEFYVEDVCDLLREKDFQQLEAKKDLNGNFRMVKAELGG